MMQEVRESRQISILSAPSNLGLKPLSGGQPGVRELPTVLLNRNLLLLLQAEYAGAVVPPEYNFIPDPFTGLRNESEISNYIIELADRIGDLMACPSFHSSGAAIAAFS
jgi:hypothetical protein